jgi:hypothetical protein
MKTTTQYFNLKFAVIIAFIIVIANGLQATTLFENFDSPSAASTNNTAKDITYPSGVWNVCAITKPTTATENDRINGIYSMRMRGLTGQNFMFMKFDKAGAGILSFNYGSYSNYSNGEFTIQQSTDGGANWVNVGTPVTVPKWSGTFLSYSLPINYNGNIRFKIVVTCRAVNNPNEQFNIDDFQITDFGSEQTAIPVSSVATGVYETPQTVTITSATSGATIYYTTDGTAPTTSSMIYSTPLNVTTTTKIRAIAVATGKVDSREEVVLISFPISISTLAEFTAKLATTGTNITYFKYTGEAVISYYYTTSSVAGYGTTITKYAFLQDNTAGVSLKDNNKVLTKNYATGDKITGIILQVYNINNTVQIYPYADFTIVSSNNILTPVVSTIASIASKPYQLVQLNNVLFDGADGTKTFGVNNSIFLKEGSNTVSTFPLRIPSLLTIAPDFQGTIIPTTTKNIVGIVSKSETSFTDYSLFVRNAAELDLQVSRIQTLRLNNLFVSNNKVYFETSSVEKVIVYSINGQLVKSVKSSIGMNSIELKNGVYLFRIGDRIVKVIL